MNNCVADLPKRFQRLLPSGKDGVYVFAMADDKAVLAGVTAVGSIALPAGLAKAERAISIEQLCGC